MLQRGLTGGGGMLSGLGNLLRRRKAMRSGQAMQKAQGSAYGRAMNTQPQGPATNSLSRGAMDNPQPQGRGATDQQRLRQGADMQKQGMTQSLSRLNTQLRSAPLRKKPLRKKPGALSQGTMGNTMRGAVGAMAGGMNR